MATLPSTHTTKYVMFRNNTAKTQIDIPHTHVRFSFLYSFLGESSLFWFYVKFFGLFLCKILKSLNFSIFFFCFFQKHCHMCSPQPSFAVPPQIPSKLDNRSQINHTHCGIFGPSHELAQYPWFANVVVLRSFVRSVLMALPRLRYLILSSLPVFYFITLFYFSFFYTQIHYFSKKKYGHTFSNTNTHFTQCRIFFYQIPIEGKGKKEKYCIHPGSTACQFREIFRRVLSRSLVQAPKQ